jgi:hypothetical protein
MRSGAWWSQHQESAIATLVGVVATVIVAVLVARYQRAFRRISYMIIARQRLIPVTGYEQYSDLRILFQDDLVKEPWIVIVHISNTGKQDIAPGDITKPISVDVGNNANIRDARVTGSSPEDVYAAARLPIDENGQPFLEPVAINRGNTIYVQLLLDGAPQEVTVVGRGVGIDKLERIEPQQRNDPDARATNRNFRVLAAVVAISALTAALSTGVTLTFADRRLEPTPATLRSLIIW